MEGEFSLDDFKPDLYEVSQTLVICVVLPNGSMKSLLDSVLSFPSGCVYYLSGLVLFERNRAETDVARSD